MTKIETVSDIQPGDSMALCIDKASHFAELIALAMAGRLPPDAEVTWWIRWEGNHHKITAKTRVSGLNVAKFELDELNRLFNAIFKKPGLVFVGHLEQKGTVVITINPFSIQILEKEFSDPSR